MSAHTPGPWWVVDSGVRDVGSYICHTNKAPYYEGQDERYERETAEREANARLIAAAPELLDAVERLCGSLGVMVTDPDNDADILFGRAAIAKAVQP